ncbi:MAG TPA: AbrB/MazE/SpoVT family DNA-binding domain-containing protein [Pyrinomonadaceae bacterium]|jgi:antitoxin MazE|nr:AbrB/MazE/SpoVT family DNA-binding domain-containing protein [Pyrinomonadaceae bacterium]
MKTQVQKWGNSLAVRIPKSFAHESKISEGSTVEVSLDDGRIVVEPISEEYDLRELLAKITKKNIHEEIFSAGPLGKEVW